MKSLINDHRTFMRGKLYTGRFYRDENLVISVEAERVGERSDNTGIRIQLDVLDEGLDKTSRYDHTYPLQTAFDYLNIHDIQLVNERIYVLVSQHYYSNSRQDDYNLYILDLNDGKLLENRTIDGWESPAEGNYAQVPAITPQRLTDTGKHIVLNVTGVSTKTDDHGNIYDSEPLSSRLYSFSYETGKLAKLPEHFSMVKENQTVTDSIQEDTYYFGAFDRSGLSLSRFDLSSHKGDIDYAAVTAASLGGDKIEAVQIVEERIYILLKKGNKSIAAVLDLKDGKPLFIGTPAVIGDEKNAAERLNALRLLNLEIDYSLID